MRRRHQSRQGQGSANYLLFVYDIFRDLKLFAQSEKCITATITGYIDLSKRRVYAKDLLQCEERYAKAKVYRYIDIYIPEYGKNKLDGFSSIE